MALNKEIIMQKVVFPWKHWKNV